MNFIYKKRSMLNFKESVAKVKFAPNFGEMATIGIQTSITKNVIIIIFFRFFGVYTGREVYARSMRNSPDNRDISDILNEKKKIA